jgi:hypothetical protein
MYLPSSLAAGHLAGDGNLYFGSLGADSTYDYGGMFSAPGVGHPWYALTGVDADSITGDPRFADASSVLAFDPRLLPGSPAIGHGTGGSDLGASSTTVPLVDATPPGTVSTLAAVAMTSNSVTLRWTAPGDDGAAGTPARYDLRRSLLPITAANFAAATPLSPQPPVLAGGTVQTFVVSALNPATTYHFALRAVDEAGNWSGVSNSAPATTTAAQDTTPPAAIGDLRAY